MITKTCFKCKKNKTVSEFHKNTSTADGHAAECKLCKKKRNSRYYAKNKEKIISNVNKNSKENVGRVKAAKKRYYEKNKEVVIERALEWAKNNSDKRIQICRKWNRKNPDIKRASVRKRRAKRKDINEKYTVEMENITKNAFGYMCANCNICHNISIDHHRPLSSGHPLTLDNAVVLCRSCNSSKGSKYPEEFYTEDKLDYIESILEIYK